MLTRLNQRQGFAVEGVMTSSATALRTRPTALTLIAFLVIVIGVGSLIGISSAPDPWYEALRKPPFNPPNWVFGPVWLALYVVMAIAGARAWQRGATRPAFVIWGVQILLNWAWSPTWFVLHALWPAFAIIVAMWLSIAAFIVVNWRQDRPAALMLVPYLAWVSFAGLLNFAVAVMN